jgi:hypothetical protein
MLKARNGVSSSRLRTAQGAARGQGTPRAHKGEGEGEGGGAKELMRGRSG